MTIDDYIIVDNNTISLEQLGDIYIYDSYINDNYILLQQIYQDLEYINNEIYNIKNKTTTSNPPKQPNFFEKLFCLC